MLTLCFADLRRQSGGELAALRALKAKNTLIARQEVVGCHVLARACFGTYCDAVALESQITRNVPTESWPHLIYARSSGTASKMQIEILRTQVLSRAGAWIVLASRLWTASERCYYYYCSPL